MAIETQPESAQAPGGREPGGTPKARAWWLRPAFHTALHRRGHRLRLRALARQLHRQPATSRSARPTTTTSRSCSAICLPGVLGWLIGLGVFNDLVRQMLGQPIPVNRGGEGSRRRPGPVLPVLARPQGGRHPVPGRHAHLLLHRRPVRDGDQDRAAVADLPRAQPSAYLEVVGEHGTMMMMMMTSVIVGPLGNYLVPLMIGSKRVAFPRIEALSFWLTPCAYVILLSSIAARRVPDRLDRVRAAVHPGRRGHGRLRGRVRPDGHLDHPGRLQHHRHDHLLPGARHALEPAADVRLVDAHHRRSCSCWPRRCWSAACT